MSRTVLAAFLTEQDYQERLSRLDVDLLNALSHAIPIEGRKTMSIDCTQAYPIYFSNLIKGVPIAPPAIEPLSQARSTRSKLIDITLIE